MFHVNLPGCSFTPSELVFSRQLYGSSPKQLLGSGESNHGKYVPKGSGCGTPSKWPFHGLYMGVILATY